MRFFRTFIKALAAGLCISIGAAAYLSCDNKIIGALLFTTGLFTICFFGLNLYTGKIGYVLDMPHPTDCLTTWAGNAVGCIFGGVMLRYAIPSLAEVGRAVTVAKLDIPILRATVLGIFCGILMYIAVHNYNKNPHMLGKCVGIFVCIPAFIICGFEHSIANVVYFTLGIRALSELLPMLAFTLAVSAANAIGAMLFRRLSLAFGKEEK